MPEDTCTTDDCTRPVKIKARRLCGPCYQAAWRAGQLTDEVQKGRRPENRTCEKVPGCTKAHKAFGYCKQHLDEARRKGDLPADECIFDGCGRPRHIQEEGYCLTHHRQLKAGKVLTPIAPRKSRDGTCPGPECDKPIRADGLCGAHYWQRSQGQELQPIKRLAPEDDRRGNPCSVCAGHGDTERLAYTTDGLCRTHARRRAAEEIDWDRRIPPKAPDGAGHIDANGYRVIQHEGRKRPEHCVFVEQLLGRPLSAVENVHHVNGHRADNRTDGPLRVVNGKLRSGNLELWSKSQPAGQEVPAKLLWAVELLEQYGEFLEPDLVERLRPLVP